MRITIPRRSIFGPSLNRFKSIPLHPTTHHTEQVVPKNNPIQPKHVPNPKVEYQDQINTISSKIINDDDVKKWEILKLLEIYNKDGKFLEYKDILIKDDDMSKYWMKEDIPTQYTVEVLMQSFDGSGMAIVDDRGNTKVLYIPFAIVGDHVKVEMGKHFRIHAEAKLNQVVKASTNRKDHLISCQYFGKCSGCQLQMLGYEKQLDYKKNLISRAYEIFFNEQERNEHTFEIPQPETLIGSPLQLAYRTKLTPHFQKSSKRDIEEIPAIGFAQTGRLSRKNIDIEKCEIATSIVNESYSALRENVRDNISSFAKGSTLLIKESFDGPNCEERIGITNPNYEIYEKINNNVFSYASSTFFQVNTSILPSLISYLEKFLKNDNGGNKYENLIDTYCGAGFLSISLNKNFTSVHGIEISKSSVFSAKRNAELNKVKNAYYYAGDSEAIFKSIEDLNRDTSVLIMNPSRKGSTEKFLRQVSSFQPKLIIYLSCNVLTQARDIKLLSVMENGWKYTVKDLRGLDFFPQTKHTESIIILERVRD